MRDITMRITPLDIRNQPFKQSFRGYEVYAVRAFLEAVAKQDEELIRQNNEFATRIKGLEEQLEKYTKIEQALNETLMTAQRLSDEAKVAAQREAELIIKDAQIRAERTENEARHRVNLLESDIISIRNQRDSFLARFKAMLSTQLELLEVISGDLRSGDQQKQDELIQEPQRRQPPQPPRSPLIRGSGFGDDDTLDIDDVPPQPVILA
jgi:cell division initiation protein